MVVPQQRPYSFLMTERTHLTCSFCGTAMERTDQFCGACGRMRAQVSPAVNTGLDDKPPYSPRKSGIGLRFLLVSFWATIWGGAWAAAYAAWSLGGVPLLLSIRPEIYNNPSAYMLYEWTDSSLLEIFFVAGNVAGFVTAVLSGRAAGWVKGAIGPVRVLLSGVIAVALLASAATLFAGLFLDPSVGQFGALGSSDLFPVVLLAGWVVASVVTGVFFVLLPRPKRVQMPSGFHLKTLIAWASGALAGAGVIIALIQF